MINYAAEERPFKFSLSQLVDINVSEEFGEVKACSRHANGENQYLIHYKSATGCASEKWFGESALTATECQEHPGAPVFAGVSLPAGVKVEEQLLQGESRDLLRRLAEAFSEAASEMKPACSAARADAARSAHVIPVAQFKFALHQLVFVPKGADGVFGEVKARVEYAGGENKYLIRLATLPGLNTTAWFDESQLIADECGMYPGRPLILGQDTTRNTPLPPTK